MRFEREGRARRAAAITAGVLGLVAGAVSCSLDLDESLLDETSDGGPFPSEDGAFDAAVDGGDDDGEAGGPEVSTCATDDDCKTTHGCLTGKCDARRKRCVYDVCRPAACTAAACDDEARTCGEGTPYKYKASQFDIGAPLACSRCVAAVHPWLFVATALGPVAFDVSNPASPAPRRVPVVGLGFVPTQLLQSGDRVWMIGGASGGGPSRVPVAYVDPPTDPFATQIAAHTVLATYSRPSEAITSFARGGDSMLLVGPAGAQYPSAFVEAPLAEPLSLTATQLPFTNNTVPVATSGERLLMANNGAGEASFYFIEGAGSAAPASGPAEALGDAGAFTTARVFAQSPGGGVLWAAGVQVTRGYLGVQTGAARVSFLVPNDKGAIEGAASVEVEVYALDTVAANAAIFGAGSAAMLDDDTAIVATLAHENAGQTSVQFVGRAPLRLLTEADGTTPRRQVLPVPVGSVVAAAASNGVAYLVSNGSGADPTGTVFVFDPACAP